jgi:scyllo-inositol 2-dehydrogenase (NADP+)
MINLAVVGLGKMGLSHLAMARAHPQVNLAAVCDSSGYVLDVLGKYTGVKTFTSMTDMLASTQLDAVLIATPSHLHADMVRTALDHGLHVFCEKPFCVDVAAGTELADLATTKGLVTQVGYHNRHVASFREVKNLLDAGAIGTVSHALAESYGPVVLKPSGGTWRSKRASGGGCLYDYAAHAVDLLTWYFGSPEAVSGSVLNRIFSKEIDDEVYSTLYFPGATTAQLSVNWSDDSERKMTTKMTLWGTQGRIYADRQEIRVYLRDGAELPDGYHVGWNVRYTTELTDSVWFYLRGEEYSAQIDAFVQRVEAGKREGVNTFDTAVATDRVLDMILQDSERRPQATQAAQVAPIDRGSSASPARVAVRPRPRWFRRGAR